MDLKKMSGEELAEVLAQQYELLFQSQHNLRAIKEELERRKAGKEKANGVDS